MQNSTMNLVKSLEETLSFVSSENAKKGRRSFDSYSIIYSTNYSQFSLCIR